MIREVSCLNSKQKIVFGKSNNNVLSSAKNSSNPVESSIPTKKYSLSNVEANYFPFKNNLISFGSDTARAKQRKKAKPLFTRMSGVTDVSSLPPSDFINGDFCNHTANNLAIMLGPNKRVVLVTEEGVSPEILVHQFTKNINANKYAGQGFESPETEIISIEPKNMNDYDEDIKKTLKSFSESNPKRKKIAFINNLHSHIGNLDLESYPNVSVVGLVPKSQIEPKDVANGIRELEGLEELSKMPRLDLTGLGADETKKFLKANQKYLSDVFANYDKFNLSIRPEAIDELIDSTSTVIKGAFPAKATKILSFISAAKVNEAYDLSFEQGANLIIDNNFVINFFKNHSEIIDKLREENLKVKILERPKLRFIDLGGMKTPKEEIADDILDYVLNNEEYIKSGRKLPAGMLLVGPPGTGKTSLAIATAGEAGITCVHMNGSDFGNIYQNSGPIAVREAFAQAKDFIRKSGKNVGLFIIDEVDAVAPKRAASSTGNGDITKTTTAFLTELDGIDNKNSDIKIIPIGTTNRPDIIDPGVTDRPSRLGRKIEVDIARRKEERKEILNIYAKDKPFASDAEKTILIDKLAEMTEGLNNDKLANIFDQTLSYIFKRPGEKVINFYDMFEGFLRTVEGRAQKNDLTAEEKKLVALHECGHAFMHKILKYGKVLFVSNEERGEHYAAAYFIEDQRQLKSTDSILREIATSYAGGDAEELLKSGHSCGVSADYRNLTEIAEKAVKSWGLGIKTPKISFYNDEGTLKNDLVRANIQKISDDIEFITSEGHKISKMVLDFGKDFIFNVYGKMYDEALAAGDEKRMNFVGKEFDELVDKWLIDTNRVQKREKLLAVVNKMVKNIDKMRRI